MNPQLTDRIQRAHQRYQALTGAQLPHGAPSGAPVV